MISVAMLQYLELSIHAVGLDTRRRSLYLTIFLKSADSRPEVLSPLHPTAAVWDNSNLEALKDRASHPNPDLDPSPFLDPWRGVSLSSAASCRQLDSSDPEPPPAKPKLSITASAIHAHNQFSIVRYNRSASISFRCRASASSSPLQNCVRPYLVRYGTRVSTSNPFSSWPE